MKKPVWREIISRVFTENTGMAVQSITLVGYNHYQLTTEAGTYSVEIDRGSGARAVMLVSGEKPFSWKGNQQTTARIYLTI